MNWQISEICDRAGLSPRTVRYYEELGLLPGVRRRSGGRRVYGRGELERLRFIRRLKQVGLSLEEIRELNAVHALEGSTQAMLGRLDELLAGRLDDVDRKLAELGDLRDEIGRYRQHVQARLHGRRAGRRANGSGGEP